MKRLFYVLLIFLFILTPVNHPVSASEQLALAADEVLALTETQVRSFNCASVVDIPLIECQALVALYSSTNGAGWTNTTNWLSSPPAGNWFGVTVSGGTVTKIDLTNNNLSGSIPANLADLSGLWFLKFNVTTQPVETILGK